MCKFDSYGSGCLTFGCGLRQRTEALKDPILGLAGVDNLALQQNHLSVNDHSLNFCSQLREADIPRHLVQDLSKIIIQRFSMHQ